MIFKKSPEKFWNLISARYAASPISDVTAYETKIEKIKSYLSPEDVVLDIGCGTGTQCDDLAGDVKRVTGIDISSKLLAIAEQRKAERQLDNVEFINTSLYDERLKADDFDGKNRLREQLFLIYDNANSRNNYSQVPNSCNLTKRIHSNTVIPAFSITRFL